MTSEHCKNWTLKEDSRLINYQHQHRGISFIKLLLPPTTDREVNIIGLDDHIYRGRIPRVREDQLPPEVDAAAIDEEKLYREIRDMNFPPVPPQEPLGPSRRIGGSYTMPKKLTLAPVKLDFGAGLEETMILGRDGSVYRGTAKYASTVELDKQLRGTKRAILKVRQRPKSQGFVEPAVIALQGIGKSSEYGRRQAPLVQLPISNVGRIIELVKGQCKDNDADKHGTQETKSTEDAQGTKDTEDTQEATDTGDAQDTTDTEETGDAQEAGGTEDAQETEESEDTQDTEGTDDAQETEESEATQDTEGTDDAQETEGTEEAQETGGTEGTDDAQKTEGTEEAQETGGTEEAQETGGTEDVQETGDTEDLPATGNIEGEQETGSTGGEVENTDELPDTENVD